MSEIERVNALRFRALLKFVREFYKNISLFYFLPPFTSTRDITCVSITHPRRQRYFTNKKISHCGVFVRGLEFIFFT
ncbi:CLUMA_CG002803, isoform A [Clunio marinus]|uniref:CLUMA_CG002803, isoform A n=1 Tax=Clunio marinus TaxID=568069 RepID=A0A1J1HNZ4_9DIPT|nr:CLUMA_CG002803, isoform A [Clunio marinus]